MSTAWQQLAQAELETSAVVASVNRGALCTVNIDGGMTALCKISGKMQRHAGRGTRINVAPGDKVRVKLAPPDYQRGIITWRL